jgi:hypothetical protein
MMRAPVSNLPIVFEKVSVVARAVTILDRVTLTFAGCAYSRDRAKRIGQDHAAARRDGG